MYISTYTNIDIIEEKIITKHTVSSPCLQAYCITWGTLLAIGKKQGSSWTQPLFFFFFKLQVVGSSQWQVWPLWMTAIATGGYGGRLPQCVRGEPPSDVASPSGWHMSTLAETSIVTTSLHRFLETRWTGVLWVIAALCFTRLSCLTTWLLVLSFLGVDVLCSADLENWLSHIRVKEIVSGQNGDFTSRSSQEMRKRDRISLY